jgi:hypothetical protein
LETLLQEMREKGAGEEPRVLPHVERAPEAEQAVLAGTTAHRLPAGVTEWPKPLWLTSCGWRFGFNMKVQIMAAFKLEAVQHKKCSRPGCWPSRLRQ